MARLGGYKRPWALSRVALLMVINRDWTTLKAYFSGVRTAEPVASYYRGAGLEVLLGGPQRDRVGRPQLATDQRALDVRYAPDSGAKADTAGGPSRAQGV